MATHGAPDPTQCEGGAPEWAEILSELYAPSGRWLRVSVERDTRHWCLLVRIPESDLEALLGGWDELRALLAEAVSGDEPSTSSEDDR